jgi:hypothetical protein
VANPKLYIELVCLPGEPNVAAEDFLGMNWPGQKTGSWHDCGDGCGNQRGYFVEYETQMLSGCVRLGQRYPIYDIDGGGWMLVRRVQPGLTWHPATDGLSGTQAAYGKWTNDPTSQSTFNIRFDTIPYDQFLFATGDGQEWLIANRNEVQTIHPGIFQGAIEKSSLHPSAPSSAQWYHRRNNKEDPWISLTDHASAIGRGNLMYGCVSTCTLVQPLVLLRYTYLHFILIATERINLAKRTPAKFYRCTMEPMYLFGCKPIEKDAWSTRSPRPERLYAP